MSEIFNAVISLFNRKSTFNKYIRNVIPLYSDALMPLIESYFDFPSFGKYIDYSTYAILGLGAEFFLNL